MASQLQPLSQQSVQLSDGSWLLLTEVRYLAQNDLVDVEGTVVGEAKFMNLEGGSDPRTNSNVATPGASSPAVSRVVIGTTTAGTVNNRVLVVTRHTGSLGTGEGA